MRYSLHGNSTLGNYTGVVALDPWHPLYVYNPGYIYNLIPGWEPHNITIADIKGKPSPLYNVTWNDVDNNDLFSSGDTFFISNTGGLIGKAETGFYFLLVTHATGIPNIYEGRNIIFLN
ncbi:MAG: hypothetical protein QMD21_07810 [Candidatus Thermoplasmatota archaeon]|nr:hypothetical protein [Candidatus Thermoplasmatota archaeon]